MLLKMFSNDQRYQNRWFINDIVEEILTGTNVTSHFFLFSIKIILFVWVLYV